MENAREKYLSGQIKRAAWQTIRKTVLWTEEYQETGTISHSRLTKTEFIYASPDFERLIKEYATYIS